MKALLSIALMLLCGSLHAATWSTDGSFADVQATITDDADHGDTVTIPAGAVAWPSTLTITKAITLQGAGIGQTYVTNTQASTRIMAITLRGGAGDVGDPTITTRITGIDWRATGTGNDFIQVEGQIIDNRRIRIDHCRWYETGFWAIKVDTCYGVIDHNIIIGKTSGTPVFGIYYLNSFYNSGTSRSWGDGAWADPDNYGTDNRLFLHLAVWCCLLHGCDNYVTNASVTTTGTTKYADAKDFFCSTVVAYT